jgi:hypothetical protein
VYEADGTSGLVTLLLAAADRLRLRRLQRVYVSLPLEEAARLAGLGSSAEVERLVAAMVRAAALCACCCLLPTAGLRRVVSIARRPCTVAKRAQPRFADHVTAGENDAVVCESSEFPWQRDTGAEAARAVPDLDSESEGSSHDCVAIRVYVRVVQ